MNPLNMFPKKVSIGFCKSFAGHVIKGWDIAIPTMKLGEVCEIIVSSEYGYDDGKIRHFEVELLDLYGISH